MFAISFSKEKNLRSWRLCGAVPLTRAPVHHRSVRRELSTELIQDQIAPDNDFTVLLDYHDGGFDWTSHTLHQLQTLNHAACSWLQAHGYKGNSYTIGPSCNVTELQLLLRWKLGGEYHQHNKKKSVELQALWLQHQGDPNPSNITHPQEIQEPTVPAIAETELGRIRQRNFQNGLNNMAGYTAAQLMSCISLLLHC
mmetsp:Transcript_16874/g.24027  ORF Transcript_16874/g.24027 Transcript_16874/m.24027 type:complete len:197 (-) Transcript_16874:123-713(-)